MSGETEKKPDKIFRASTSGLYQRAMKPHIGSQGHFCGFYLSHDYNEEIFCSKTKRLWPNEISQSYNSPRKFNAKAVIKNITYSIQKLSYYKELVMNPANFKGRNKDHRISCWKVHDRVQS